MSIPLYIQVIVDDLSSRSLIERENASEVEKRIHSLMKAMNLEVIDRTANPKKETKLKTFKITVTQLVPDSELDHDDKEENPAGEHIRRSATQDEAMDDFHNSVPIACLDDFDITIEETA